MREIKFRVWDSYKKEYWRQPFVSILVQSGQILSRQTPGESWSETSPKNEYLVPQQYTGIQDENKQDIYEGDIVKYSGSPLIAAIFNPHILDYTRGEIKWLSCGWKVCQKHLGATPLDDFLECECHPSPLIVIGNIFENPELL